MLNRIIKSIYIVNIRMAIQHKGLLTDRILRWEHIGIPKQTTGIKHIKRYTIIMAAINSKHVY